MMSFAQLVGGNNSCSTPSLEAAPSQRASPAGLPRRGLRGAH